MSSLASAGLGTGSGEGGKYRRELQSFLEGFKRGGLTAGPSA